jgi:hypothetical protein
MSVSLISTRRNSEAEKCRYGDDGITNYLNFVPFLFIISECLSASPISLGTQFDIPPVPLFDSAATEHATLSRRLINSLPSSWFRE